jgi:hypothetical protein
VVRQLYVSGVVPRTTCCELDYSRQRREIPNTKGTKLLVPSSRLLVWWLLLLGPLDPRPLVLLLQLLLLLLLVVVVVVVVVGHVWHYRVSLPTRRLRLLDQWDGQQRDVVPWDCECWRCHHCPRIMLEWIWILSVTTQQQQQQQLQQRRWLCLGVLVESRDVPVDRTGFDDEQQPQSK